MEKYISKLFGVIVGNNDWYDEYTLSSSGFPSLTYIENELAFRKNPLLVVPEHLSGLLLSESGNFKRNPYGYRPYENRYFLYHRFVDTQSIMLGDKRINRLLVIERDENNQPKENDFCIFHIHL